MSFIGWKSYWKKHIFVYYAYFWGLKRPFRAKCFINDQIYWHCLQQALFSSTTFNRQKSFNTFFLETPCAYRYSCVYNIQKVCIEDKYKVKFELCFLIWNISSKAVKWKLKFLQLRKREGALTKKLEVLVKNTGCLSFRTYFPREICNFVFAIFYFFDRLCILTCTFQYIYTIS